MKTYRMVRVVQQAVDVEVPDEELAKGEASVEEYVKRRGTLPFEDEDWHTYMDAPNRRKIVLRIFAYMKNPYEDDKS